MRLPELRETTSMALASITENKVRAILTILGIVIGIATVMSMTAIIHGLRRQIVASIEIAGPTTFYVMRFLSDTPLNPDNLPREVRIRPILEAEEAAVLARVPQVGYAAIWIQLFQRLEFEGVRTQTMTVFAADDRFMEIQGGNLVSGRFFTTAELRSGVPVVVLEREAVATLFGNRNPIGRTVRVAGRPMRVIGVYQLPENIFQPPAQQVAAIVSFEAADRYFRYDETNNLFYVVKPRPRVSIEEAQDAVTVAMRRYRGLRPSDPNTFDFLTQEQILDIFNKITSVFFLVMLVLSSVALMVGGIGVMAIMMVSVTDRTREIGIRKAVGATRQEIRWQFLMEAATLTLFGGLIGVLVGAATGEALRRALGFSVGTPGWSPLVAVGVSVAIGLVFGVAPAARAARLDPIAALRYE